MIAAVLFDLYETLITESSITPTRASSLAEVLGLERDAYRKEWNARRPRVVRGQLSLSEALTEISQTLSGKADKAAIREICHRRVREKAAAYAGISDDVAALVTALARRDVGLAVISNGFEEDVVGWSRCALAPDFRCAVFSCTEQVAKPDPEIYQRALRRLGVNPAEAVYIGDGGDDELSGAERAGLRAYRAAWFVQTQPRDGSWPALADPGDVLKLVEGGYTRAH